MTSEIVQNLTIKFYTIIDVLQYFLMEHQLRTSNKPKQYAKIPLNKRIKLVQLVTQKSLSIAKASVKLAIRPSTAKLILKKYREQGGFFEKRSEKLARLAVVKEAQEASPSIVPQQVPLQSQNLYSNGQSFVNAPMECNAYPYAGSPVFGMGEWNGEQNFFLRSFLSYGLVQYAPVPFYY